MNCCQAETFLGFTVKYLTQENSNFNPTWLQSNNSRALKFCRLSETDLVDNLTLKLLQFVKKITLNTLFP